MMRPESTKLGVLSITLLLAIATFATAADKKEKRGPLSRQKKLITTKEAPVETYNAYVGTYTGSGSKGIYLCKFNAQTGEIGEAQLAAEVGSPSFVAIHPNQKFLYAVTESAEFNGKPSGSVSAFAIDAKSGKLTLLNRQSSQGAGPCHLVVDATGKNVLVANYSAGSIACLPIDADGKLKEATSAIQHTGSSVDKDRQEAPHAHSINVDLGNRYVFVADLGLDKVLVYKLDAEKGLLTPNDPPSASVEPGSGPRHFAFHPSGHFAYVINEMGNTVTAFSYDESRGELKSLQSISTLPADFKGTSYTAEVQVHPTGKFVYGSNRGHDSIAVFRVDEKTGKLTFVETEPTQGKFPRNFRLDPAGNFLLAENQDSDNIVVFKIDQESGALAPTGHKVKVSKPCCIRMMPAAK